MTWKCHDSSLGIVIWVHMFQLPAGYINGQCENLLLDMKADVGDYGQSSVKRRFLYSLCFSSFADE